MARHGARGPRPPIGRRRPRRPRVPGGPAWEDPGRCAPRPARRVRAPGGAVGPGGGSRGAIARRETRGAVTLALKWPYGWRSLGSRPRPLATSVIGRGSAAWAMSMSLGTGVRRGTAAPLLLSDEGASIAGASGLRVRGAGGRDGVAGGGGACREGREGSGRRGAACGSLGARAPARRPRGDAGGPRPAARNAGGGAPRRGASRRVPRPRAQGRPGGRGGAGSASAPEGRPRHRARRSRRPVPRHANGRRTSRPRPTPRPSDPAPPQVPVGSTRRPRPPIPRSP